MNSSCQAVFLHTGYRTAGTWLWSCFRKLDNVTAYYEPLHEMLATIDPEKLASSTANSWRSGHPTLDAPYFAEFAHLLGPGARGIPGYDPVFSIDRLDGQTPEAADQLEAYVRGLMRTAHGHSELVNPGDVIFTLLGFAGLYLLLGMLFVVQVLKEINRGPAASH